MRVRDFFGRKMYNLQQVTVPILGSYTSENIFKMLVKVTDALNDPWNAKLIGMSSEEESTMKDRHRHSDLVTRMVATDINPTIRVWCASHHVNLVVSLAAKCVTEES
uniref:Uncharacterized protein n=1 Tax=Peronospora matthiolae TaxID=2874970 RepID=A0AAV1T9R1_9STRA